MTPGMLQDHLGWITAQIKAGVPLETITASMMSRAEAGLLQRCALPRYFDRQLVDEVLRAGVPGGESTVLPFQELVKNEAIERVPRTAGVYRVRPRHRARTPGEASAIPALDVTEVARLNHLLAEHVGSRPFKRRKRVPQLLANSRNERVVEFVRPMSGDADAQRQAWLRGMRSHGAG